MTSTTGKRPARTGDAVVNDGAVVDAARLVFAVHGPEAPVSAVAAQAGVGIGSLYRRFPSKQALLQYLCLESMRQFETLATEALEGADPWGAFRRFVHECATRRVGAFGATIAGLVQATPELRVTAKRGHELLERLLARGREHGVIRPDIVATDVRLLIELFSRRPPDDSDGHDRLIDIALDGLSAAGPRTRLASEPLSWPDYLARWR